MELDRGSAAIVVAIVGTGGIAVAGLIALGQTARGVFAAALLAILIVAWIGTRRVREREIVLLALGEMVVLSAGVAGPAYAALLQLLVLGLIAREAGVLGYRRQTKHFMLFAVIASAGTALLLIPAHALVPFLAVIVAGVVSYLTIQVSEYVQMRTPGGRA